MNTSRRQTLRQVHALTWIVIEDSDAKTPLVARLLEASGVASTVHLSVRTPASMRRKICTQINPKAGCPLGSLGKVPKKNKKK